MKVKKNISIFLILVFVLQLLPIRQAVNYFFVDNITVEEILHEAKAPAKNSNSLDEDHHLIYGHYFLSHTHFLTGNSAMAFYKAMLPSSHADDIETPPPNSVIS